MTLPLPSTMKAAVRSGWTGFTLSFDDEFPTPALCGQPDKVLLKVHAAALNPVDYKLPKLVLGSVFGSDLCGTIVELPPSYSGDLKVGDVVVGTGAGSLAEYTIADVSRVTKLPAHWSPEEGAGLPVACGTALAGFQTAGMLPEDLSMPDKPLISSLLVIGSSGGCGLTALQLAKGLTIPRVIGICSSKNADLCRTHGATEIVPYDDQDQMDTFLKENAGKVDVIYDAASASGGVGEDYCDNPLVLALLSNEANTASPYILLNTPILKGAKMLAFGNVLGFKLQQSIVVGPKFHDAGLQLGIEILDKAGLKPLINTSQGLTETSVVEGYKSLKSRRTKGKIVISISSPE
ncbi:furan-3-one reductase [Seminavis robusta]|uniref:Furan-3-one reductase n=1 Tax=Seminavis robusta TaxID=568900 RepID=A0A9N8DVR4_9STRA|nr:furan-3-one reductase [Seminavis robusta]|eukprot:Sro282_g107500.1 furan-3-one reductase (349) ;mRNA; r:38443-39563